MGLRKKDRRADALVDGGGEGERVLCFIKVPGGRKHDAQRIRERPEDSIARGSHLVPPGVEELNEPGRGTLVVCERRNT